MFKHATLVRAAYGGARLLPKRLLQMAVVLRPPFTLTMGNSRRYSEASDRFASIPGSIHAEKLLILMYTCKVCRTRSIRKISRDSYEHGVVIVRCPGCEKLHLIADNLKFFDDCKTNIESILRSKGGSIKSNVDGNVFEISAADKSALEGILGPESPKFL